MLRLRVRKTLRMPDPLTQKMKASRFWQMTFRYKRRSTRFEIKRLLYLRNDLPINHIFLDSSRLEAEGPLLHKGPCPPSKDERRFVLSGEVGLTAWCGFCACR